MVNRRTKLPRRRPQRFERVVVYLVDLVGVFEVAPKNYVVKLSQRVRLAGGNCRNLRLQAEVAFRSAKEAFAWVIGRTAFLQSYCQLSSLRRIRSKTLLNGQSKNVCRFRDKRFVKID